MNMTMAHEEPKPDLLCSDYDTTTQRNIAAFSLHQHSMFADHNIHCHQSLLRLDQSSALRLTETLHQASVQMADKHKQVR